MKTYACPFCNEKLHRDKLVKHIEKEHDDEVPHNMTPYHLVYDIVNDKHGHGNCTVCGQPTKWNENRQKYNRLCGNPKCYEDVKKTYQKRMLRVYNKIYLTDDPKHQEKMLANRRISSSYKWSDGKMFTYTGKYEKQLLEFLDQVMNYQSNEIITPGPILEYEYKGQKHHWITDCIILPYNLIIEVKDGGDNPNKRSMPEYRAKQLAKEKMITNLGKYHYLRLTNNDFGQLLSIIAELKMQVVDDTDKPIYRIHEESEYTNIYFQEASRIKDFTSLAESDFFNYIIETFPVRVETVNVLYEHNEDSISSFCIITPKENDRYEFESIVESIQDYCHSFDNELYQYKGCYLNEENPIDGYMFGIEYIAFI